MIYFIQMGSNGPIKIGLTSNVEQRLSQLQVSSPYPLRLLATLKGGSRIEKDLHQKFAKHRMEGEWFSPERELTDYIENIGDAEIPVYHNVVHHCRICNLTFCPGSQEDLEHHRKRHKKLSAGILPYRVREFLNSWGWAVAHNDGGIERRIGMCSESEMGRLAVAFSWWARALDGGINRRHFNEYMSDHLDFIDAAVDSPDSINEVYENKIKKWEKFYSD